VDSDAIIANEDEVFGVIAQGTNGAVHLMWIEDLENAYTSNLAAVYVNSGNLGSVRIATGDNGGPGPNYWEFNNSGALTFPQGTTIATADGTDAFIIDGAADKDVQIYTYSGETARGWTFGTDGDLEIPGNIKSEGNINIDINLADSTLRRWQFGEDGDLETPGGIQVAGILKIDDGVHEKFQTKADATGIVTHDCSLGHIFYHTSPDALFTVNFTNLNLSSGYATALTLIIVQGGTGFIPNSVGIGGVIQTLNWQGNVTPTPSTNRTDVVTFSIICTATDTYTVLGQLTGF
jgi:hypothetical protein